jgi:hypothetical protein
MQKTENKICRAKEETLARTNLELSHKIAELRNRQNALG